ncbi:MAG: CDP-alcohol phosphatidyltransferase family protein [Oligoflexia bacterium]|nr:CDP-alcohol phosphatidyltransferase family protein [Oligoflexia bacterium]MBF0365568.1 CDP-alcohol phosphatidyltransferase family protein [Oligoflexia bacterium]
MISIYKIRAALRPLLRPLVVALVQMGITANQITVFACASSCLFGLALWFFPHNHTLLLCLPLLLFFRMTMNAIGGMITREHNMKSHFGTILNELTDVIADLALYYPFILVLDVGPHWVAILLLLTVLAEMAGVVGTQIGVSRHYEGPFGKSNRAFIFGLTALLIGLEINLTPASEYILGIMMVLAALTILNRIKGILGEHNL